MICTVSTVKDSLSNVRHFVEGNLAAGADHLFVFVEGGDREVLSHLDQHPHVTAVDADAETDRSKSLNTRQTINANRVNHLLADVPEAQWLFHIDGDEFLDIDKERLLALGAEVEVVRLMPKESVSTSHPEYSGYVKHLLTPDELALLKVLDLVDSASNRRWFHGHVLGKVGIRPSRDLGLHIHHARRYGAEQTMEDFRAEWLHVVHHESVTLQEFVRKWEAHIGAGPATKFRGEKELIRAAIRGVLANDHLDEEGRRRCLAEIYRRRVEDDVPALLDLGVLDPDPVHDYEPDSFPRRRLRRLERQLPQLLTLDPNFFRPLQREGDPVS